MKAKSALSVALAAGIASTAAAANTPTTLAPSNSQVQDIAHIYFNIATGEKVVTVLGDGQTAPADNGVSGPIWSSLNGNFCADAGAYTTSYFFGVDNNALTSMGGPPTSLATAITNIDYGDIAVDTVVDCVHIDWVVNHPDVDGDSDGLGDGVAGLGGQWTYWDADNGRLINASTRLPIISFAFLDLPGNIADPGFLSGYTADIDLATTFTASSLTFEIGDSDGNLQGAAFGNSLVDVDSDGIGDFPIADTSTDGNGFPNVDRDFDGNPDADLDGDGLFDWSWGVRFFQPGTADQDGDGIIDGDIADSMQTIGISFAGPDGTAVQNGPLDWTWDIDTSGVDAGTGQEDRFAIYAPPDLNGDILYAGGFWFGGMECESLPLPGGPGYTPAAMFEHQLFGPSNTGGCLGDINGDGATNFFDIGPFITALNNEDPIGDINGDMATNFFDIGPFIAALNAGCDTNTP